MPLHRKHLLTEKKKILAATALAKKIGYLKVTDLVPSGIVDLPTQSFNPHRIIGTKNKLFLLSEGTIEVWHTHYDKLVKTLEPGTLFGNMSLLGQVMIGTRAISGTQGSVLAEITTDTVREWINGNPLEVAERIGSRLTKVEVEHYRAIFQLADSRVAALLLELANEDLTIQGLSHKDLALRIGVYRETVTNTLGSMKADRLIKVGRERITILDKRALQELSEL